MTTTLKAIARAMGIALLLVSNLSAGATDDNTSSPTRSAKGPIPPPRRELTGTTFPAGLGTVYVPRHFQCGADGSFDLVVFFHGATWCAQQGFEDSCRNGVLVSVSLGDYVAAFRDPASFGDILKRTGDRLAEDGIATGPMKRLCLASFSGGYAAVREILSQPQWAGRVTDVVLADSLYGKRETENGDKLTSSAITPFLDFARRAATGEAHFVFSHLHPPLEEHRGNTTSVAARQLMSELDVKPRPDDGKTVTGREIGYKATKGGLVILGIEGMTTQDHFEHFYGIADLYRLTGLEKSAKCPK